MKLTKLLKINKHKMSKKMTSINKQNNLKTQKYNKIMRRKKKQKSLFNKYKNNKLNKIITKT